MNKYKNNTRQRRSIRLKGFDYSSGGFYFVTVCTSGKKCILCEIVDNQVHLTQWGVIVKECWEQISYHHNNVETDGFIVMPNHVHGIVVIPDSRGTACRAPTVEQFGKPSKDSLPTIMRSFKSAVTKKVNEIKNTPGDIFWQRNYYERVIRNEKELELIRQYIITNPSQWELDQENPDCKGKMMEKLQPFLNEPGVRNAMPLRKLQ